jgi:hypothetical protein
VDKLIGLAPGNIAFWEVVLVSTWGSQDVTFDMIELSLAYHEILEDPHRIYKSFDDFLSISHNC